MYGRHESSRVSMHSKADFRSSSPSSTVCLKGPRSTVRTKSGYEQQTLTSSRSEVVRSHFLLHEIKGEDNLIVNVLLHFGLFPC